jgi:monomeric isocitrate dehydrogenase
MCDEVLEKIVKIIDIDQRSYKILDKINELVYDTDIEIKAATISLLTRIVNLFPDEVKYNQLT